MTEAMKTIREVTQVTLQNLKDALYLNNLILLGKIDEVKALIESTGGNNLNDHTSNLVIHVTQKDKDTWNAILDNAKQYAKELFNASTSLQIIKVTELPTEDIKTACIYFLAVDPIDKNYYEEYMYLDGQWELIGNTRVNLEQYILKTEVEELLKDYLLKIDSHEHENLLVLNDLSDADGLLNYKGIPVFPVVTDIEIQQAITDTLNQLNS